MEKIDLEDNDKLFEFNNSHSPIFENSFDIQNNNFDFPTSHFLNDLGISEIEKETKDYSKKEKLIVEKKEVNFVISQKLNKNPKTQKPKKLDDISMRKYIKHLLFDNLMSFFNAKIKEYYNGKIGLSFCIKKFQTLNKKIRSETNILYNKEFINRKLEDIFSENISERLTNFSPQHNKNLIIKLLNENNYFKKLFDLTFLDCIKHFRGEYKEELKGMYTLNDEIENNLGDNEYIETLKYYINNYETIIQNKKSRISRKQKLKDQKK